MNPSNPYFLAILGIVVGFYLLDLVATLLNLSALKKDPPRSVADIYDPEEYARSQNYTRESTRFGLIHSAFDLVVLLVFWLCGGFHWLNELCLGFGQGPIVTGLIFFGILFLASQLLDLPFDLYDTFVLEEKFGFNKMTLGTFVGDMLKGLLLAAVLGLPLLALVLWLFGKFDHAWIHTWVAFSAFTLLLTYLAPRLILPLFNKFEPLEDGSLKSAILAMAKKCEFPLTEISIMDGSKRSSKSNAFFTGFGKTKKIALYDTLVENHSEEELVAVLAHEIGHYKRKHIVQQIVIGILQTGLLFFLLGLFLNNPQLSAAFGIATPTVYLSLVFFGFLFKPLSKLIGIITTMLSRKWEFEADAFAAEATQSPDDLVTALKTLSKDNLSNLTPHPFYTFLYYTHPPVSERITALEKLA